MKLDSSDKLLVIVIAVILLFVIGLTCISCRTIKKNTKKCDTTSVITHEYINDSTASIELQRLLQKYKENVTFSLSYINISRDSDGNERREIKTLNLNKKSENSNDSLKVKAEVNENIAAKDSADHRISTEVTHKTREPPCWIIIACFFAFIIFIRVYIKH